MKFEVWVERLLITLKLSLAVTIAYRTWQRLEPLLAPYPVFKWYMDVWQARLPVIIDFMLISWLAGMLFIDYWFRSKK